MNLYVVSCKGFDTRLVQAGLLSCESHALSGFQHPQLPGAEGARRIREFTVARHRGIVAVRGVDGSPSGVEKRGKGGSCHCVRTHGNSVIVLSRCVED